LELEATPRALAYLPVSAIQELVLDL
jgi:hypothetical protein